MAIQWMRYVRAYARGINYWIATPSAMARNDKDDKIHITWILGQNVPHKNIRFCGDPAPQDDRCVWWKPRAPG